MIIDQVFYNRLSDEARKSPRLRMSFDLRNGDKDQSQRILNAIEPGSVIPIHRHPYSSETLIVLRGKVKEVLYDDCGNLEKSIELIAGGNISVMQIEKGKWHSLESLETGTVVFEAKDGPYLPLSSLDIMK